MNKAKPINGWTKKTIIKHIRENFKGRSTIGSKCAYRSYDGKKCAVGLFIPDRLYSPDFEGASSRGLLDNFRRLRKYMPLDDDTLRQLQLVHDYETKGRSKSKDLDLLLNFIKNKVE